MRGVVRHGRWLVGSSCTSGTVMLGRWCCWCCWMGDDEVCGDVVSARIRLVTGRARALQLVGTWWVPESGSFWSGQSCHQVVEDRAVLPVAQAEISIRVAPRIKHSTQLKTPPCSRCYKTRTNQPVGGTEQYTSRTGWEFQTRTTKLLFLERASMRGLHLVLRMVGMVSHMRRITLSCNIIAWE